MFHSEVKSNSVDFTPNLENGIWFDPERITLEGRYSDQVTAYRARKKWAKALETSFLLEGKHDFSLSIERCPNSYEGVSEGTYAVTCDFHTACGRYAFWRLTHNQAPEVQFLLETAHLSTSATLSSYSDGLVHNENIRESQLFNSEMRERPLQDAVRACLDWISWRLRRRIR